MISIINNFFKSVNNINEGMVFLNENKTFKYDNYSSIQTKKIIYSLMIYKFGNELQCHEKLKVQSRTIILHILDPVKYPKSILQREIAIYLKEFDIWKNKDLYDILVELAGSYINLEETKKSILNNNNLTDVDKEWILNLEQLMDKIFRYGNKLNQEKFKSVLDNLRIDLNKQKEQVVTDIMEKMFWQKFYEELKDNKFDMLFENFEEIKKILHEIKTENVIDEILDINYLKQLIEHNLFDANYLISYINYIVNILLKYGIPAYDKIIKETQLMLINNIKTNGVTPEIITDTYRYLMDFLNKLIKVIRIYRNI